MDILLIRHGQSVANVKKLLISTDQDGLTEEGKSQSIRLRHTLAEMKLSPSLVYCSPWRRARETAEILFDDVDDIMFDGRLAETHPGIYGSWLEADFNAKFPAFNKEIRNSYEGGESHYDMTNRVNAWLESEVHPRVGTDGILAAVAHGGPISAALQHLLQIPVESHYPSFTVPNASFTFLKWRGDLNRYCAVQVGHI
ncbi:phosphoglycerate mutase [Burkholderia ubonensis]|uniref:histidine phosphatase family protein n=1 Tax=Burkholderia ubonensis TaxID=101571 RepID=UPI000757D83F|nr:histidine phosphatase family protein [Burkholderia ubonensis]KVM68205.1 phosphoglycerate mutase [Burkholderia ubonensis]KWN58169.1 phosphoglycerate mutase [Burkholderia ubonensis]